MEETSHTKAHLYTTRRGMDGEGICDTDDRSEDLKSSKGGLGEGQKELDEFGKALVQR